jgi:hypothetical protein
MTIDSRIRLNPQMTVLEGTVSWGVDRKNKLAGHTNQPTNAMAVSSHAEMVSTGHPHYRTVTKILR